MVLLVSACLMGLPTRYDGTPAMADLRALARKHTLVPVCPEQLGGLPTPRPPCEIMCGRVRTREGQDVTEAFALGAARTLDVCRLCGCEAAVLKLRSPSCGKGKVYDGTFTGTLVPGDGVTAALLLSQGIPVYGEDEAALLD